MKGLNHCEFIGRLTGEPEIKTMPSGSPLAQFAIAVNTGKGDETMTVGCAAFGDAAKVIAQSAQRGQQIYVNGRITLRSWIGADRQQHLLISLTVNDYLLGELDWESQVGDEAAP